MFFTQKITHFRLKFTELPYIKVLQNRVLVDIVLSLVRKTMLIY